MNKLREFLNTAAGKVVTTVAGLVILLVLVWLGKGYFGAGEAEALSTDRVFIDAKTRKQYNYTVQMGDKIPVKAPSGGNTGYPAEPCYWTKDGKIKNEPTWVLLEEYVGKPGPTFCPDCGKLVRSHNPAPSGPETRPPPTKEEYGKR